VGAWAGNRCTHHPIATSKLRPRRTVLRFMAANLRGVRPWIGDDPAAELGTDRLPVSSEFGQRRGKAQNTTTANGCGSCPDSAGKIRVGLCRRDHRLTRIYLDNNATTPLIPAVWDAMRPFLIDHPGNPASSHAFGRAARRALEDAREQIAALTNAHSDEVIFTSGATEANNLALFGLAPTEPGVIATSSVEHPSVLEPVRRLANRGYMHCMLPVTMAGSIDVDGVDFPESVGLVSVMLANHETGAMQPVKQLATMLDGRAPLHCDAAAAAGKVPVAFHQLGVTALSFTAHKFHGPPGVGALLVRRSTKLHPLFWGGHQQQGRRPGSEPVALVVGMAAALDWCNRNWEIHHTRAMSLRQQFLADLDAHGVRYVLNGPAHDGIPYTLNLSFPGYTADTLLMKFDLAGVACSTGSACSSGSMLVSPVLQAMGIQAELLRSAMRFSFGALTEDKDVREAARRIFFCLKELRSECAAVVPEPER
jgi:cysteine desulfurase